MTPRLCPVLIVVALAVAGPASGQSVFATNGLGHQVEPQDGRSRALGGAALGFPEPEISWANPASAIGLIAPGLSLTYQYDEFSADAGADTFEGQTARFPLLLAVFPAGERLVFQAGFGSYLDQNWRLQEQDTLVFAGADSVGVVDVITSDGGVTRLRFGAGYHFGGGLGLGAAADFHTGSVQREEGRTFDPERGINDTLLRRTWRYRGVGYTVGAHWSPGQAGGVGVSVSYGGTLKAEPRDDEAEERSYDLPISIQAGGTGRVLPNLLVALGGSWSGWSSVDDDLLLPGSTSDSWSVQGGVEWDGISLRERPIPLRIGGRTGVLPFSTEGSGESITERAFTFGSGLLLAGGAVRPDVAAEFGTRSEGSALDESYWRLSASIRVMGR
jgi:long-subunit fatty acid transport protein